VRDLATVVRQIGKKDGYTMVMEKGEILWGTPTIDITDEVIRAYDSMHVRPGSLAEQEVGGSPQASGAPDLGNSSSSGQFGSAYSSHKRSTISR
jgi:hypothetical protein